MPRKRPLVDPRERPAYGVAEAAHYLRIPPATLRAWVRGQYYRTLAGQEGFFRPVVKLPDPSRSLLSFMNLVEVHVLDAIRRDHRVPLQTVRKALAYLDNTFPSRHPLADYQFATSGLTIFIQHYGSLIDISKHGQMAMREVLEAYLRRIDRDEAGLAARLYPFTRKRHTDEPRVVVIDPLLAFGRPVIVGSGIPTAIVAERYKAGESIDELARDYSRERLEIEEAIRCELALDAAA